MTYNSDIEPVVHEEPGFELYTDALQCISLEPARISPIAFRTIVITIDPKYPEAGMTKDDFMVTLVPISLEITHLEVNNNGIR